MCKIYCSTNRIKISKNRIIEFIVIFKKSGNYYCMHFFFCGVKLRGLFLYITCWLKPHGYHNDSCRFGGIARNMQQLTNAKIVSQYLAQGLNYANESYLENLKPLTIEINYVAHYCCRHLVFLHKFVCFLCPPNPEDGGIYCFWCGSGCRRRWHQRRLFRFHALSSELVDKF